MGSPCWATVSRHIRLRFGANQEEAWGWTGLDPDQVVGDNDFGNLMIKDQCGRYWRLCPEDPYCKVVAANREELDALSKNQEFLCDWYMRGRVKQAKETLGPLRPGYKYCFKVPGTLGGEYGGSNLASISLRELITASGHIANEIRNRGQTGISRWKYRSDPISQTPISHGKFKSDPYFLLQVTTAPLCVPAAPERGRYL